MTTRNEQQIARSYAALYSRAGVLDLIKYGDSRVCHQVYDYCDEDRAFDNKGQLFRHAYNRMAKLYRCEYVFKNEIINNLLLKHFGTSHTVAYNEFKVLGSIADMAMFNGESKSFEIKTEYDSPQRLSGQMFDYTRLFQKNYLVIPESRLSEYKDCVGSSIGIIVLFYQNRHIDLEEYRPAVENHNIDPLAVIGCLRTEEYKHLVKSHYGELPVAPDYQMYDICKEMMRYIPSDELQQLFLKEIESRKNNSAILHKLPYYMRQMGLSLRLSENEVSELNHQLRQPLNP